MLNKAVIDLKAITDNALAVKELLPSRTKLCAVVKADGYGHGAVKIANALYGICDSFAVALPEEGIELRLGGIDKEILVLARPQGEDIARSVYYGLTLTAARAEDVLLAEREGAKQHSAVRAHIKYNTGMNRLGADTQAELLNLIRLARGSGHVKITGLYSHYAAPEAPALRAAQTERFTRAVEAARAEAGEITAHISASGGFLAGEYFDMVRIGILLYGYSPFETDKIKVRPAMKIYAPVIAERRLKAGESAMYGNFPALRETDIRIIRYGYADGLPRKRAAGQFNNRCMDVTAVISDKNGGKYYPVLTDAAALARSYGTISYEILTKAALRAEKIYRY